MTSTTLAAPLAPDTAAAAPRWPVAAVEALFALVQRVVVSEGVRARTPRRLRRSATVPPTLPYGQAPG